MRIERQDLDRAVSSDILSRAQARALWKYLAQRRSHSSARDEATGTGSVAPLAAASRRSLRSTILGGALGIVLWSAGVMLAPALLGWKPSAFERALLSAAIGGVVLAIAFYMDGSTRHDRAGPLYVAGLIAVVLAVATAGEPAARASSENVGSPGAAAPLGAALVLLGLALRRGSFAVFGALALAGAAGHAADHALDGAAFHVALVAVALAFGAAAFAWRRVATPIGDALVARLPPPVRRALETRRGTACPRDPGT